MPPTFDAGLRKPNSLIEEALCSVFTQVASLRLKPGYADLAAQLRRRPVKRSLHFRVGQIEHENRVTDLRIGGPMPQIGAQSFESQPLEYSNSFHPRHRAVVCYQGYSCRWVGRSRPVPLHLGERGLILLFVSPRPWTDFPRVHALECRCAHAVNAAIQLKKRLIPGRMILRKPLRFDAIRFRIGRAEVGEIDRLRV